MRDVQVRPDKSDNEITMKINQWAADTYPVAQKHLDTARTLENRDEETFDQLKAVDSPTPSLCSDVSRAHVCPSEVNGYLRPPTCASSLVQRWPSAGVGPIDGRVFDAQVLLIRKETSAGRPASTGGNATIRALGPEPNHNFIGFSSGPGASPGTWVENAPGGSRFRPPEPGRTSSTGGVADTAAGEEPHGRHRFERPHVAVT